MSDSFEVLELIGRGTFGEIRKVRRQRDGQVLCRKEIMWKRMNRRQQEQLAAEMRILRDLQHNNIVRYISEVVDSDTKMVYIYMEYCGNGDLYELIQSRKDSSPIVRFSEHTVWQIFGQLVLALYRCHNGVDPPPIEDVTQPSTLGEAQTPAPRASSIVLHRDIKPQNVFLDHHNRVKLGDFGLSKEISGQGLAETYVGTPFYMSPEIIAGRTYNAKSDIWALGCVIYEMCAFEPPFMAQSQMELNRKIKLGHVSSVTRYGFSESLNAAIQSCLRQNEAQRPSAAGLLRRPEIVLARQQLMCFEHETTISDRELALVAREKEVERAINLKLQEFQAREEALSRRERSVQKFEANGGSNLVDSTQRRLYEAQRQVELITDEKLKLEKLVDSLQRRSADRSSTPSNHILPPDELKDEAMTDSSSSIQPKSSRPSLPRSQTELIDRTNYDPLHLMPKPRPSLSRAETQSRGLRSPNRRKSQVPMSRIRSDLGTREPLQEQSAGVQSLSRVLSRQDLSKIANGIENIRPNSATGIIDRDVLMRTPHRDVANKTVSSPRRPIAYASPTRVAARTLFDDDGGKQHHQRSAPPPPSRSATMIEGMYKARLQRDSKPVTNYEDDDIPSPYIKKVYPIRPT